jgi:3-keto-disaccharide hydrolase
VNARPVRESLPDRLQDGRSCFREDFFQWLPGFDRRKYTMVYLTRSIFVLAIVVLSLPSSGSGEGLRLLESPGLWDRLEGTDDSFEFVAGKLLIRRSDNEPAAILTKEDYENFELDFEFKVHQWCESGLFIHAPRNGAFRAGIEIELGAYNRDDAYASGAVFRKVPALTAAVKGYGHWNACRVEMDWPRLHVLLNGEVVQDLDLSEHEELRHSLRRGAIGFQNLGFGVDVRNFVLHPLPDTEKGIVLFNGKDLSGWRVVRGDTDWTVEDGAIRAESGDGYLGHDSICQDFDLRMMVRTSPVGNGGVFFRWKPNDTDDRGNEIQILDSPGSVMTTGSIYGYARGNDLALTPGEWELLQISVRGKRAVTHLNGLRCAETDRLEVVRPGHVVLQMHKRGSVIEFKDIVLVPADDRKE